MRIEESTLDDGDVGYREKAPSATQIHRSGRPATRSFYVGRRREWRAALLLTTAITLALGGLFAYLAAQAPSPPAMIWAMFGLALLVMLIAHIHTPAGPTSTRCAGSRMSAPISPRA